MVGVEAGTAEVEAGSVPRMSHRSTFRTVGATSRAGATWCGNRGE